MALKGPTDPRTVSPVNKKALELASDLAKIDLTKFRFKIGCVLILGAVLMFFLGHLVAFASYFKGDFTDRSWTLTLILLVLGAAFAGKEVVEALGSTVKSLKSG